MTKTEHFPAVVEARPHGNRGHMRRKLSPMAYVELGQDNGGILLNLSEGGFAVQSALALTSREFPELRFQVPALQGWLAASGRIVWISDSKKEAGIQFTELPGDARTEIQKWVAAEGATEKYKERIPGAALPPVAAPPRIARPKETVEPRKQTFDGPYEGRGGAHEPAVAYNARVNGTEPESENARTQRETPGVVVAEAQPQDFHFTDYSMFAAAPERETVWAQPPRHKGGWRAAVMGILVAALFFALGATVGRETVSRWIAYARAWTQSQLTTAPVPKVTPPAAPEQAAAADASNDRTAKSTTGEDQEQAKSGETPGANSGSAANSDGAKVASEEKSDVEAKAGKVEAASGGSARDAASAGGSTAGSANAAGGNERLPRRSTENVAPRDNRQTVADASRTSAEHSILVNAPEPGSAPFFVNFSNDAVSASGAIAMSARRSLEIMPRSSVASSGSERVVIGKLIAHSEPFYPAEARSRGIEGSVELRARVGRTGGIVGVTPVSGPLLLFPAAVAAVREWRYEPTYVNGDPVETLADITIVFRLR
jgi:TonB family protein